MDPATCGNIVGQMLADVFRCRVTLTNMEAQQMGIAI